MSCLNNNCGSSNNNFRNSNNNFRNDNNNFRNDNNNFRNDNNNFRNNSFKYLNYICSENNPSVFENMPKCQLMEHLQIISFAIDDLRLFIDTHPNCEDAIECINELMTLRHMVLKQYTTKYGPIYSYMVDTDNGWDWTSAPLPWSKGGM